MAVLEVAHQQLKKTKQNKKKETTTWAKLPFTQTKFSVNKSRNSVKGIDGEKVGFMLLLYSE